MKLRDYQDFAVESIFRYFEEGKDGNPVVVMPTGTGKSLVIGGFIHRVYERYHGQRIMKLTHVKELIEQNLDKLLRMWPTAPAGVYSAGLGRKEAYCPITYAGIATAYKVAEQFGHIDLILVDECHLVSPKEDTMYQAFFKVMKKINPNLRVIGFTATHYRMGQGLITENGNIFTDVCVDMSSMESFNWFLSEGYLVPLIPRPTKTELDVEGVQIHQGEYNLKQLQQSVDKEEITYAALKETLFYADGRNHWLVFASGIEHTENVASMLDSLGVPTTYVHSKMKSTERDQRINDYRAGRYRAMVNNGVLTTGFDYPSIDLIVMLRPTRSPGLWVQMLGRGTRADYASGFDLGTTEGRLTAISNSAKKECLVLDFAGNTRRLGPINDPVVPKKKGSGGGTAPVRICDKCGNYIHASLLVCPICGMEFPRAFHVGAVAGLEVLVASSTPQVEDFKVDRVVYTEHRKQDRPTSIKASYYCGFRKFDEYICLEHLGFARTKARQWWRDRVGGVSEIESTPPDTVEEAFTMMQLLRTPSTITVWINKKHPEVLTYEYPDIPITTSGNEAATD